MDKIKTLLSSTVALKFPLRFYKFILRKKGKYTKSDLNSLIYKIDNIYFSDSEISLKPVSSQITPLSQQAIFKKKNEVDLNE